MISLPVGICDTIVSNNKSWCWLREVENTWNPSLRHTNKPKKSPVVNIICRSLTLSIHQMCTYSTHEKMYYNAVWIINNWKFILDLKKKNRSKCEEVSNMRLWLADWIFRANETNNNNNKHKSADGILCTVLQ